MNVINFARNSLGKTCPPLAEVDCGAERNKTEAVKRYAKELSSFNPLSQKLIALLMFSKTSSAVPGKLSYLLRLRHLLQRRTK
jgi:hypothetical protein